LSSQHQGNPGRLLAGGTLQPIEAGSFPSQIQFGRNLLISCKKLDILSSVKLTGLAE
jgi:hypothetical protein